MEDADGGFSFDFERGLDMPQAVPSFNSEGQQQAVSTVAAAALGQLNDPTTASVEAFKLGQGPRRTFRQTVCRHWIRGLCMKGDLCGFLHQLDRGRMPICRFFTRYGECREPDCIFKHTNEDIKECNMYMLGFCPNGPDCRYRHVKLPGPVPSLEESYQKIQQRMSMTNHGTQNSRYGAQRQGLNSLQGETQQWSAPVPSSHVEATVSPGANTQNMQQMQSQVPEMHQQPQPQPQLLTSPPPPLSQQLQGPQQTQATFPNQATSSMPLKGTVGLPAIQSAVFVSASTPLPHGYSRYFVVKSCNRENLELSAGRGMWATHRNNEAKLNDAFDSCDNVILVFSINETGHFQGCARMESKIGVISGGGTWKYANGNTHYGRNFLLKWLKLCELSFHKTRHLRNSYNENLPVKISRDCQELEPTVGEQLASLLYTEPDSDLMKTANEVEAKREEEKAKELASVKEIEDADVLPCQDGDEEEEQSNEDDSSSQTTSQNKGDNNNKGMHSNGGRGMRASLRPSGRIGRGRERGVTSTAFALGYDRLGASSADSLGLQAPTVGRGFPPYYPLPALPRYGGQIFPTVRPMSTLGFSPMDASLPASGMVFPINRQPPNGLYSHKAALGIMGPPGAALMGGARALNPSRSRLVSVQGAGRQSRLGATPVRTSQNGGSTSVLARRGGNNPQRRPRNSGSSGELRKIADGGKPSQPNEGTLGLEDGGVQPGHRSVLARNFLLEEAAESSSEDEAPRRSRYGEGKKRRRDGEGEQIETLRGNLRGGSDQQYEVAY